MQVLLAHVSFCNGPMQMFSQTHIALQLTLILEKHCSSYVYTGGSILLALLLPHCVTLQSCPFPLPRSAHAPPPPPPPPCLSVQTCCKASPHPSETYAMAGWTLHTPPFGAGHSLGGALATLAAFDIQKQLVAANQRNAQVVCYTFAAPRTGNHAFAREYNAMVPDTWSVINDQVVGGWTSFQACCCLLSMFSTTLLRTSPQFAGIRPHFT